MISRCTRIYSSYVPIKWGLEISFHRCAGKSFHRETRKGYNEMIFVSKWLALRHCHKLLRFCKVFKVLTRSIIWLHGFRLGFLFRPQKHSNTTNAVPKTAYETRNACLQYCSTFTSFTSFHKVKLVKLLFQQLKTLHGKGKVFLGEDTAQLLVQPLTDTPLRNWISGKIR